MASPKKWSVPFRLWHWLHAGVILALLGTVFLRKTFLSWRANSEIVIHKLLDFGIDITAEQAKILAKAIRAPMWEWHILLGYALALLFVWRLALFFTPSGQHSYTGFGSLSLHHKVVKAGYLLLYTVIAFMVLSGLIIHFYDSIGLSKETAHDIKELHEAAYLFILIFVPLHIAGVVIADISDEPCIVSDMINGGES